MTVVCVETSVNFVVEWIDGYLYTDHFSNNQI